MRIIGNMMTGSDQQQLMILNSNLLISLSFVIEHKSFHIRSNAMWISSNILAGPPDNIQRCLETGLLSWILEVLLDIESVQHMNKE